METGINTGTLKFAYLMACWHYNCIWEAYSKHWSILEASGNPSGKIRNGPLLTLLFIS